MSLLNSKTISGLLACSFFVLPASAGIIATTGGVTVLASPPASVQFNQLQSNTNVFAFQEKSGFTVGLPIELDVSTPGLYDSVSDIPLLPTLIPTGTVVNSYYLSADPDLDLVSTNNVLFSGRGITFSPGEMIIGLQILPRTLIPGRLILGASGTAYPPPPVGFGLELSDFVIFDGSDSFTISGDRNSLTFDWITGGGIDTGGADQIRIVTSSSVPEPGTIFLLLFGTLCLAAPGIKSAVSRRL